MMKSRSEMFLPKRGKAVGDGGCKFTPEGGG
jgi:hypothetical protein